MVIPPIELELRKLGLSEKEVRVYLAGFELGPSSVKKIAETAKITRPTTYEIIRKLEEKGLFMETKQKTKRYFAAQSPEKILGLLKIQKREIEEKEREFIRIIAALEEKYSKRKGIKLYKGKEGLKVLEDTLSFSTTSEIFTVNFARAKKLNTAFQKIKKRLGKIQVKKITNSRLKGTLIVFNKVIFLPSQKEEGYLVEDELMVSLLKSFF